MSAIKRNPTTRSVDRHVKQLIDIAKDDSIDYRLTPGQIHAIVTTILEKEPAAHIASLVKLAEAVTSPPSAISPAAPSSPRSTPMR